MTFRYLTTTTGDDIAVNPEAVAYVRPRVGGSLVVFIGAAENLAVAGSVDAVVAELRGEGSE